MPAPVILVASRTDTVSLVSPLALTIPSHVERLCACRFQLSVTAAGAAAGDLLDIYVQHALDGTNYDDFVHFTQIKGNDAMPARYYAVWLRDIQPGGPNIRKMGTRALAAQTIYHGPTGNTWKVDAVIVSAGTPSFTWKLEADFMMGNS